MATVLAVSGSPSASSRTARLLHPVKERLARLGHEVTTLDVRALPAAALLGADTGHPEIARAAALVRDAEGVVIGTPVHKAAYSGLLKSFLDVLPQDALTDKTVLPLATGGTARHTSWRSTTPSGPSSVPWAPRTSCAACSSWTGTSRRRVRTARWWRRTRRGNCSAWRTTSRRP